MYNLPKYKFILNVNGAKTVVFPLYQDSAAKELEKEGEYEFFRAKWSGKLVFIKRDYNLINDAPFDTIFELEVQLRNYVTGLYEEYYTGGFVKTDLDFFNGDGEPEKVELKKLETYDEYKPVLDGLRNEYNLIELNPDITSLEFDNRPLWQFYVMGGTHVLNVLGGTFWETEVEPTYSFNLLSTISRFREIVISVNIDGTPTNVSIYIRTLHNVPNITSLPDWSLVNNNVSTQTISENDYLGQESTGYKYVIMWDQFLADIPVMVFGSQDVQDDITEYGRVSQGCVDVGKYYSQKTSQVSSYNAIPLNKSVWGCFSLWVDYERIKNFYTDPAIYNGVMTQKFTYPFTYKISEVLRVFIQKLNPNLTHEASVEYSEFLYNTGESNVISGDQYIPIITPKSNFLTKNADQPAIRAITTLDDILKDLFASHKLQWHIDDENRFRLEHVNWYDKGGRYTGSPNIQINLLSWYNRKARKLWAYQQNNITYDKAEMPERYHFEWSESVSPAFEGSPIEILSNYVELGRKEEIGARIMTTDVEYMIANAGDISKSNFALFAGVVTDTLNELSGSDSDMNSANNWIELLGTNKFDVNVTYPGKLYLKILSTDPISAGTAINPNNFGGTYQYRNTYDIEFKCRKIGVADVVMAIYTLGESGFGAVAVTFEPTGTEEVYKFSNIVATGPYFMFQSYNKAVDAECVFDDVKIIPSDTYFMPLKTFVINNYLYHLQNADLSWYFLHEKFWKYKLPAPDIIVNGVQTTAITLNKGKEQEIEFPYLTDPNSLELIKTQVGNGEIKKLSINLLSRMIKATLKYDTE